MNSACTATTLSQCETLCAMTFPGGGLDGTVDLLKLLQWCTGLFLWILNVGCVALAHGDAARYSTYSFQEELILSAEMRTLRRLSRKYGVPWEEVDNVKRHGQFDNVDEDGSGDITFEEFSDVLRRVLQVPQNLDLPVNRVRHFWKELDHDGSGKADFTEFLPWWLKYFHNKEGRKMLVKPFEDFYRNVRNLKNPDPPPYRKGKKVVTAASGAPSKKDHFQD
ncbi:TNNC2, partial [Symbiodinium sp. CCMP2592]